LTEEAISKEAADALDIVVASNASAEAERLNKPKPEGDVVTGARVGGGTCSAESNADVDVEVVAVEVEVATKDFGITRAR
jgi:hypothetical protein